VPYVTYSLNFLLMLATPFMLGAFLARRMGTRWDLFWAGAATFIASQAVHLPLNALLLPAFQRGVAAGLPYTWQQPATAIALGLSAGLCEELARYLALRFWLKDVRTWRPALMFGAGHGGIEAVILGALAALTATNIFMLRNVDPAQLGVRADQVPTVIAQIDALWRLPWFMPLLGAVERAFTLAIHLGLTILVLQAFTRRNPLWLLAAIGWHTLVDAGVLILLPAWGPVWTEVAIGVAALVSLGFVFALRQSEPELPAPAPLPPLITAAEPMPAAVTAEQLERTRFQ
jgi:uncharacterized membrane protein YhfC